MARRFQEQTLHTGRVAYLRAPGLVELDFPVLVRPTETRYDYVVARYPVEDEAGLFHRIWEPTRAMRLVATDAFRGWYIGRPEPLYEDQYIWEAIRRIHQLANTAHPDMYAHAGRFMQRVSEALTRRSGAFVPPVSLATVGEFYEAWGSLVFPNHVTASVTSATLLLMLGVPRERVAVFGMYYQDPTVFYRPDSDWRAGFLSGTPYYTVLGLYLEGRWIPVDMAVLGKGAHSQLPPSPRLHLRNPDLGDYAEGGVSLIIDYAHPYTMLFAPMEPGGSRESPLLARIPLLELPGWNRFVDQLRSKRRLG